MSVAIVEGAISALSRFDLFKVEVSRFYRTPAFPADSGPDFVNGVISIETTLSAQSVLDALHQIEAEAGRTRERRWEARVLDLDLIDYGGAIAPDAETHKHWRELPLEQQMTQAPDQMILPHPRVQDRPFVLVPLRDVAPDWRHPVLAVSVDDLLAGFTPEALGEIQPVSGS